ncbi:MAG: hydrolase [Rhodospirillaceae bacterium]|jgi:2-keto-4-pentenoate hydratase/2-oxohepta-3-ene-1,7-dioic acid hydratase in catechol pathway|nr:hydrolase [Rhodospirillaceae bacterium]MBT5459861.1 hydrolase [Rhodospirillaceae bacterium]
MKLVTFTHRGRTRLGIVHSDKKEVIDLSVAAPKLPTDMTALVASGDRGLKALETASRTRKKGARLPLSRVTLRAPVPTPRRNVLCVGKNYYDHAHEFDKSGFNATKGDSAIPELPIIFTKAPSSVIGPGVPIPGHLDPTKSVDYEVELGVVIGKGGRGITKRDAFKHVYGYTIINDVTARHLQADHKQWFLGKSIDGFCPMGPWLVTADEVGNVKKIRVESKVNGEVRQSALVKDLIFDIPTLIATLSKGMTLQPGDIIATGTPAGVGIGFKPPKFLKKGDVVTLTIDRLGVLENTVV